MKQYIGIFLLMAMPYLLAAQFIPNSLGGSPNGLSTVQGAISGKKGVVNVNFPDTASANVDPSIKLTQGLQINTPGGVIWVRDTVCKCWVKQGGGGLGSLIPGGPISSLPVIPDNPGVNITSDSFINYMFYRSQPPLATLTGGVTLELTSASTVSQTLNWSASRQAKTSPLTSIVVAGVTQTFTQPGQPGTVSGTQAVAVPANTTTVYTNLVTTSDGKSASPTTTFNFLPKRYWFYSSTATPTSADVIANLGGSSELTSTRAKAVQFVVTVTGTEKYVSYAYPSSFGALTSIIVSGIESIGAFNQTTVSVTNASGYVQNYFVYTTDNIFQNTQITFISVQ